MTNTRDDTARGPQDGSGAAAVDRRTLLQGAGLTAAAAALPVFSIMTRASPADAQGKEPLKLGFIEDYSGNLSVYGLQKLHAAQLAVKEINEGKMLKGGPVGAGGLGAEADFAGKPPTIGIQGVTLPVVNDGGQKSQKDVVFAEDEDVLVDSGEKGILGREVQLVAPDGQSNNALWQQLARRLIQQDKVDVLVAGFASAEREAIRPIVDRAKQLYFYTNQYEGGVADANTFCTGPVCEQQVIPGVSYMVEKFGPRGYTIAADYNFGQLTAAWTRAFAPLVGGKIIGEEFIPLSVSEFSTVIARIQQAKPDWVMTLLVGQNQHNYYPQAAAAGLHFPMVSTVNMAQGYEHKPLQATLSGWHAQRHSVSDGGTDQPQPCLRQTLDDDVPARPVHRRDGAEHLFHDPSLRQGGPSRGHRPISEQVKKSLEAGWTHRGAGRGGVPRAGHSPLRSLHSAGGRATRTTMSASCATGR